MIEQEDVQQENIDNSNSKAVADDNENNMLENTTTLEYEEIADSWRFKNGYILHNEDDSISRFSLRASYTPWGEVSGGKFVNNNGEIIDGAIKKGIDVSEHQGKINWDAVKKSGIDFAIIRCGYGSDYKSQDDSYFDYNTKECERLGIPYGVYLYSYANSISKAKSEAAHTLRLLRGKHPTYPIYYDLEDKVVSATGKNNIINMAEIYCSTIESNGYRAGIYANLSWWNNKLNSSNLNKYDKWIAQWNSKCTYNGDYRLWQCTSNGAVSGINGRVDLNFEFESEDTVAEERRSVHNLKNIESGVSNIKLSWTKTTDENVAGYVVYRANDKYGSYDEVARVDKSILSYNDCELTPGRTWYYKVVAYENVENNYKYGIPSKILVATTKALSNARSFIASTNSENSILLNWGIANNIDGYVIYKASTVNGGYNKLTTIAGNNVSQWTDVNLAPNTTWYYKIRTYKRINNSYYYSNMSNAVSCKTKSVAPDQPNGLRLYRNGSDRLTICWKSVDNATGYIISKSSSKNGKYKNAIVISNKTRCSWADYNVNANTRYYYKIRTYKLYNGAYYYSSFSKPINVKTQSVTPGAVKGVRMYERRSNSQIITWKSASGADGYVVYRANSKNGKYNKAETISRGKISWADYNVKNGATYYYKVRAYKAHKGKYYYGPPSSACKLKVVLK